MIAVARLVLDWLRLVRSPRARPYLAVTLFVDAALVFVFLVAIQSYLPEQHGAGASVAGYALAAYGAAKLAGQLLGGRLSDWAGARRGLLLGLALNCLGQLALLAAITEPRAALPAAAVYGLGGALVWPALYALAAREFAPPERATLTSGMTLTTGLALALGLAGGMLLPADFPYVAAIALALGALLLAAVAAGGLGGVGAGGTASPEPEASFDLADLARSIMEPQRLGFSAVMLMQSMAFGALLAVFRAWGRDLIGVSLRQEVLYLAPAAAVGAGAVVLGGLLSDRWGRIPLIGSGFLIGGIAVGCLAMVTSPAAVVPLTAMAGLGVGLALPSVGALSMDLSRTAGSGTVLGWFMTTEGLGHATGPALAAWVGAMAGPASVLWIVGGLFAGISLTAVLLAVWTGDSSEAVTAPLRGGPPLDAGLRRAENQGISLSAAGRATIVPSPIPDREGLKGES